LADAIKMLELGRIKPILSKMLPLSDANKALELLKEEKPIGRVALKP
jgi:D-arabinose 1-dehydrogenase-like Zn-dependent alcohol dehydrogenase